MKKKGMFIALIIIAVIPVYAQIEVGPVQITTAKAPSFVFGFIDMLGAGYYYNFNNEFDQPEHNFHLNYFIGFTIESPIQIDLLANVRYNFNELDLGGQLDLFIPGFSIPIGNATLNLKIPAVRKNYTIDMAGTGISLAYGVQFFNKEADVVQYFRFGFFFHVLKIFKIGAEYSYYFTGQYSIGVVATFPGIISLITGRGECHTCGQNNCLRHIGKASTNR